MAESDEGQKNFRFLILEEIDIDTNIKYIHVLQKNLHLASSPVLICVLEYSVRLSVQYSILYEYGHGFGSRTRN